MGRAIDMEKDIDMLKRQVEKLENIVRGMTHTMSEKKHIDLVEETKGEVDEKEETNDEGNDKSSGKSDNGKSDNKKPRSKSRISN